MSKRDKAKNGELPWKGPYWNYRVILGVDGGFSVREVWYDEKGEITAITESPASPWGENDDELKSDISLMLLATNKEILFEEDLLKKWEGTKNE